MLHRTVYSLVLILHTVRGEYCADDNGSMWNNCPRDARYPAYGVFCQKNVNDESHPGAYTDTCPMAKCLGDMGNSSNAGVYTDLNAWKDRGTCNFTVDELPPSKPIKVVSLHYQAYSYMGGYWNSHGNACKSSDPGVTVVKGDVGKVDAF